MKKMFPVSMIAGEPVWDSLPAAKIIHYPLEKADYKPYAQAKVCFSPDDLHIRIYCFENNPSERSLAAAAVSLFPEEDGGKRYFWFSANRSGQVICKFIDEANGTEKDLSRRASHRIFSGEDLQGIYWCVDFTLPLAVAEKLCGESYIEKGHRMKGNFYKISDDPARPHYGSYYPADFTAVNPYGSAFFGDLAAEEY
ncbi:MAG TPA: carbohydrate-binding family 9-like protein [Oscillospiraceae bacterium]|nr:carbohydrate-binding family 9-like protein [Oscillospiraceae bacterium]HRW57440.1 carbohydrate-binding family 9-like protein [Oscillospiraceae bacterium]